MRTECRIVGPYHPVGDIDWECRTHNVVCELRDPAKYGRSDIRREDVYCPKGEAVTGCSEPGCKAEVMCDYHRGRADEQKHVAKALKVARDMLPPFLGMDSFHLLAWMHEGPDPDDRDRPADALIREVWKSAHDAVLSELRRQ